VRLDAIVPKKVKAAAAKQKPNVIPIRFVFNQFTLVFQTRFASGIVRSTAYTLSKLSVPATLTCAPA
jgi:hypothetical protein